MSPHPMMLSRHEFKFQCALPLIPFLMLYLIAFQTNQSVDQKGSCLSMNSQAGKGDPAIEAFKI